MPLTEKQFEGVLEPVMEKVLSMTHNRVAARGGDEADEKAVLKALAKRLTAEAK